MNTIYLLGLVLYNNVVLTYCSTYMLVGNDQQIFQVDDNMVARENGGASTILYENGSVLVGLEVGRK